MELISTNFITFKFCHVKEGEIMSESYQDGFRLSYLKTTMNSSTDVVYASDDFGHLLFINPSAKEFFGNGLTEISVKNDDNRLSYNEVVFTDHPDRLELAKKKSITYEERVSDAQGTSFTLLTTKKPLMNDDQERIGLYCISRYLSDLTEAETTLARYTDRYQLLIEKLDQGLALHEIIIDSNGKPIDYLFLDINDYYTRIVGLTSEMVIGKRVTEVLPIVEQFWIDEYGKVATTGVSCDFENYSESLGKYFSVHAYCPKKNQFAVIVSDITDRKNKEKNMFYFSYHDCLTGLYNRRFYEEELKRLDTERNLPLSIVMGDVNGLKYINDTFGHLKGDDLLMKVADSIKKACRSDDIIARLGGDEFVILLPKTDTVEAERIIERIKEFLILETVGTRKISMSFGFETKHTIQEDIQQIFSLTEKKMYQKKSVESVRVNNDDILR